MLHYIRRFLKSLVIKLPPGLFSYYQAKRPEFRTVHSRLQAPRFSPLFYYCIGAIDETHVPVVVPASKVLQHVGRHGYSTQNVLAICDFDIRFTFFVTGWPESVHDIRVFNDAIRKYGVVLC